jgi:transmembrane protein
MDVAGSDLRLESFLGIARLLLLGGVAVASNRNTLEQKRTPHLIAGLLDNPVTLLIARIMVTAPFIAGGLTKLFDWQAGVAEMIHVGLHPPWVFNVAALATQLIGSALIILNHRVWLGAGALGVFSVWATLLAHRFWEFTGAERMMQMNSFFEHWTISAAFILVTVVGLRNTGSRS